MPTANQIADTIRLNKFIAQCGIASRRKADELIEDGQVMVNGRRVYELGVQINPKTDEIKVGGKPIKTEQELVYVLFNKPKNVLTAMSDPEGRPNVGDFFKGLPVRLFPVGRLDWDSEGLLLMTNDGEFAQRVAHPKEEIPKTYMVKVNGHPTGEHINKLLNGVSTAVGRVKASQVQRVRRGADQYDWLLVSITQGRNRQIRRMFEKIGFDVLKLQRVGIGSLTLGNLARGEYRVLPPTQAQKVFKFEQKSTIRKRSPKTKVAD